MRSANFEAATKQSADSPAGSGSGSSSGSVVVNDSGAVSVMSGVRVAALASLGFKGVIEKVAVEQIDAWRQAHAGAVARMPRSVRDLIEPLWYTGTATMLPTTVVGPRDVPGGDREGERRRVQAD